MAERLLKDSDRPVHISLSAIFREIPRRRPIQNDLHQLPLTAEVLKRVTESYENWAIRRIWWAASIIRQENVFPTRSRLIKQACLSKTIQERKDIKQALETALQWLTSGKPNLLEIE